MTSTPTSGADDGTVTAADRLLARTAAGAFGGTARVHRFHDRDHAHSVGVLTCVDAPQPGLSTHSTVGLHAAPNLLDDTDIRVELAGIAATDATAFADMLATAAFQVSKEGWLAAPGVVFPGFVDDHGLSATLQHLLWVPPFPWADLGEVVMSPALSVHWLLGIPIAESERRLLIGEGFPALERLFTEREIACHDLRRLPVDR